MKLTHAEEARLIDRYREIAKSVSARFGNTSNPVNVNNYGSVQIVEDGAFVECTIWIPKEEL